MNRNKGHVGHDQADQHMYCECPRRRKERQEQREYLKK